VPCLRTLSFVYRGDLSAFCADTFMTVYFGSQGTIALAQPSTPDAMVPFAGFAFWPALFFSLWIVGHRHSLTAQRSVPRRMEAQCRCLAKARKVPMSRRDGFCWEVHEFWTITTRELDAVGLTDFGR
jgi:hypothetical protein